MNYYQTIYYKEDDYKNVKSIIKNNNGEIVGVEDESLYVKYETKKDADNCYNKLYATDFIYGIDCE